MGSALADRAAAALKSGGPIAADRIAFRSARLMIPQRRPTPEQIHLAHWYLEQDPDTIDERDFTRRFSGHDYTFWDIESGSDARNARNERHVREVPGLWEWQTRTESRQPADEVEIQVIALGDCAVVAFPAEMFTALGRQLIDRSPLPHTIVATQTNGWHGYIPTREAFGRGGYEPHLAWLSRLAEDAGDRMVDAALDLLNDLRPQTP